MNPVYIYEKKIYILNTVNFVFNDPINIATHIIINSSDMMADRRRRCQKWDLYENNVMIHLSMCAFYIIKGSSR